MTASKLAAKGATVVVPGRNIERAEDAAEKIRAAAGGNGQVVAEVMDQLDLKSVEEFAKRVAEKYEKLDILGGLPGT